MEIKYTDLEDEVRDGFYVCSLIKCCWMAQLKILEKIDKICQKHNIQYQAEFGTLLGAVRHGGFIPWDDDMDISMKREDYKKFLKIAEKELSEDYHIISYRNDDDYWDVMARVVNSLHVNFNEGFLKENCYFPFSTGVDIFPLDYAPTNENEAKILRELVDNIKGIADDYGVGALRGEELEKALLMVEDVCNVKINREGDLRERLYDIVVSLYSLYHEEESKEIALMPLWLEHGTNIFPKEYYAKTARLPFDNKIKIHVPIAYDSILKNKYGDYMKMVRKGGGHDYPYYEKQIKIMEESGSEYPRYKYENRVIRKEEKITEEKADLREENLLILDKIHLNLGKLLLMQEKNMAMELLMKCQEHVLYMGEKIEQEVADCEELIASLEQYCEWIFQIYQVLQSGDEVDPEAVIRILQEQMMLVREAFAKDYKGKKKVVFIVDKASRWNSLKSIWKSAMEDKNAVVSVIVIPYYYKSINGKILEENYEKDLFPEEVEILDYQTVDLEQYHPDTIYINSPYDEYNHFTTVHPYFYSSNLVNWCEKLVYIPWFVLTELTREDERGWQSMQHFVTMPGVVNADKVIVQSEQMKEAYVDYLTDWAGEETRTIWEEKICGLGSPLMDIDDNFEDIEGLTPEHWKPYLYKENGQRKKMILYTMNSSSFIDYKEKAVDKLKRVLDIFRESRDDICLLWYWDTSMEVTLQTTYPEYWKVFQQIRKQYRDENWGIYEEELDYTLTVSLSDAYYGDGCKISHEMTIAEKPVMLQNYDC